MHPVGMVENSPALQRWAQGNKGSAVPKGTAEAEDHLNRPSGTDSFGLGFPTLKRR